MQPSPRAPALWPDQRRSDRKSTRLNSSHMSTPFAVFGLKKKIGRALGYPVGFDPGQLVDDYRLVARRARRFVELVFYVSTSSSLQFVSTAVDAVVTCAGR